MRQIFSFLVEPSSYTKDLVENVYKELNINSAFLINKPFPGYNDKISQNLFLSDLNIFSKLRFIFSVYKKNKLIIVNGYNNYIFIFLYVINMISSNKRVIAIESDTQYREVSGIKGFIKREYLKRIFKDIYIFGFAGGNFLHKDLFRNYGMQEKHIFLIPMMVNNAYFLKNKKINTEKFTFLFVGRMIPLKNIELLIESFLSAFSCKDDVILKIVGQGDLFRPLKIKYDSFKNILFQGPKYAKDLVQEYHKSNVLVLPSYHEQWGLVVNEAMAAGLPVIASNKVGAIQDLIIDKKTGFVFDLDKTDDLSQKMIQIYEDKALYKAYSENAEYIMKEYWNYDLYKRSLLNAILEADKLLKQNKKEEE